MPFAEKAHLMAENSMKCAVLASAVIASLLTGCYGRSDTEVQGYVEGDFVRVSLPASGIVETLSVSRGSHVKVGEVLFTLDSNREKAALDKARSELEAASAEVSNLLSAERNDEIEALQSGIAELKAQLAYTAASYRRKFNLSRSGAASMDEVERLRSEESATRAKIRASESRLRLAQLSIGREGEIEAAQNGKLPRLLECGSLKGDLHCHSNWSDGKNSIEELAAAAMAMGYEYLGIADHTHALKVAGGLDEDQLRQRNAEIDALNQKIRSQGKMFAVLKGCEANIDDDGGIDLDKGILGELDFVIAGVHMNFKMDAKKMTRRLVGAAKNPDIDIISHPTGRLLKERPAYELEIEKVFEVAKEHGAILEINAQPRRLDLKPLHVRGAIANDIKLAINTDAHRLAELEFARFGIAQARRGWATAGDIANTLPWPELKKILKRNQKRVN